MKKLLLSLGTVAAVVAPVAAVVACGSDSATSKSSANAKGHLTEITLASTKDKATLSKLTQTDIVNASKKVTDIEELLGVPAGKISPIEGSTYLWNAQALTLTYKKLVANKPFGAVVTITPKDASTKAPVGTESTTSGSTAVIDTYSPIAVSEDKAKAAAEAIVTKILTDTGYTLAPVPRQNLVKFLTKVAPTYALTVGAEDAGKSTDATDKTHGADDFFITLKGAPILKASDSEKLSVEDVAGSKTLVHTEGTNKINVGIELNEADLLEPRWGYSKDDVEHANLILVFQTDGTKTTLEVSQVAEFNGDFFMLGSTEDGAAEAMGDDQVLHKFTITKA